MSTALLGGRSYAVCVGAAKAGTTTLYGLMSRHPEAAVTTVKETNFFFAEQQFSLGLSEYMRRYFPKPGGARLLFESDPVFMVAPGCMRRIREMVPEARIIVMLRNPVDRAFSHYTYRLTYGRHDESFEEMCRAEPARIQGDVMNLLEYGFLARSRYSVQVREILELFPREQVRFLVFEKFMRNQRTEFRSLQSWLGLTPIDIEEIKDNPTGPPRSALVARLLYHPGLHGARRALGSIAALGGIKRPMVSLLQEFNRRDYRPGEKPRMAATTRSALIDQFREEIAATEALTGLDLSHWQKASDAALAERAD